MTRITKEKLGFLLKKVKYTIGQNVITEGEELHDFYLIENGEFEINKTVCVRKKSIEVYAYFLRSI